MDIDKAREVLDTNSDFHGSSDSNYPIMEGIKLLNKKGANDFHMMAEHEQIWYGDFKSTTLKMLPQEVRYMARLGWFEDPERQSWSHFV